MSPIFSPGSMVDAIPGLLDVYFVNGAHSNVNNYNEWDGVHLLLVSMDGDKRNVLAPVGLVTAETMQHLVWFLVACIELGLNVNLVPVFANRGKMKSAKCEVARWYGIYVNLKSCGFNIGGNVCDKFSVPKASGP